MKKLTILFSALIVLVSCNTTSSKQDTQMLQSKYETVYKINELNYVVCDSVHTYHITVTGDGQIFATIKIK
jgi:tRNA/tmRNA/rRNA uracil-C5-methylase (TrmA/RlmC/RlmD family)